MPHIADSLLLASLTIFAARCGVGAAAARRTTSFDDGWKFFRGDAPAAQGTQCGTEFPLDMGDLRCFGLRQQAQATTENACQLSCCGDSACSTWQFCPASAPCSPSGCWTGQSLKCENDTGWVSRARDPSKCSSLFCEPGYDDSQWKSVTIPHDWSSLDLPGRDEDESTPTLGLRYGPWRFEAGDEPDWARPDFDDNGWAHVKGGADWRVHSNLTTKNATGWYRQHFSVQDFQVNASATNPNGLILSLGVIAGSDVAYVNGVQVGCTGDSNNPQPADYVAWRRYHIPAGLLKSGPDSPNVIAVRVKSIGGAGGPPGKPGGHGGYPGGFYDDPELEDADIRSGPFDAGTSPNGRSYGYTVGGVGWYRKSFAHPVQASASSRVFLRFDGVYMNAAVYLNGQHLGTHPYGYTTFEYEITHLLNAGQGNLLAVRVANLGRNSRWYSGSGIYRHTWLTVTGGDVYVPLWGIGVSTPSIDRKVAGNVATAATVAISINVTNSGDKAVAGVAAVVHVPMEVGAASGSSARKVLPPRSTTTLNVQIQLGDGSGRASAGAASVHLWSPDTPYLYEAAVQVLVADRVVDSLNETFGVRDLHFSVDDGFLLNGVPTLLRGGCLHHANGPLGSRAIDRAEERRVELLRAQGYNAIRTSHNPVSPAFLDACDRLGMLVMDEAFDCWEQGKNTDDYHVYFDEWWRRDMEAMVLRDRNHPSVVMWSIGNEIPMRETAKGAELSATLSNYVRELDFPASGRAITSAVPFVQNDDDDFFGPLDVAGYNYSPDRYVSDHERKPKRIMVGTESFPMASFDVWSAAWHDSWVIGDFIWTSFDYIGESAIGSSSQTGDVDEVANSEPYAWHISFCGDLDIVGHQKPQGIYRNVLWDVSPIEIAVHRPGTIKGVSEWVSRWGWPDEVQSWNWDGHEGEVLSVNVYTKACNSVHLALNGKPVAGSPAHVGNDTRLTATFSVPYARGILSASCDANVTKTLQTTGPAQALDLSPDRCTIRDDPNDLSYVTATVVDLYGKRVPDATEEVTFTILSGPGRFAALGTGNPRDLSSFHVPTKKTWRGRAVAIVQPNGKGPGEVILQAAALGKKWTVRITVEEEKS